jgi:hypothetical protein
VKVGVEPDPVEGWHPVLSPHDRPLIGISSSRMKSPANCDWSMT